MPILAGQGKTNEFSDLQQKRNSEELYWGHSRAHPLHTRCASAAKLEEPLISLVFKVDVIDVLDHVLESESFSRSILIADLRSLPGAQGSKVSFNLPSMLISVCHAATRIPR